MAEIKIIVKIDKTNTALCDWWKANQTEIHVIRNKVLSALEATVEYIQQEMDGPFVNQGTVFSVAVEFEMRKSPENEIRIIAGHYVRALMHAGLSSATRECYVTTISDTGTRGFYYEK